ncbi:34-kDa subunit of RNA polymerase III (C), partial [Coemansia sp. RSA 2708]
MADSRLARLIYEASLSTPEGIENDALTELIPGHPLEDIVNTVNALLGEGKLEIKTRGSRLFYQGVAADELALLGGMDSEDRLIFKQIQSAGGEGIWVRTLGQRTNLPAAVVNRTIKLLEQRALIKAVRSLKHPRRKMYMLAQATPSAEFSGGPWYTDHEMDTDFIDQLAHQCYQFIFAFSYPRHSPGSVFSANHAAYPTASSIRQFITDNGISNVDLAIADIEQLLRMLVYDGKIERVSPSFDL